MPNASFPPGTTNVISSRNPFCFRSRGMTSEAWRLCAQMSTSFAQCPVKAAVGNHPVFKWPASLYLFKLLRWMHHTSQGLILSLCSKQQHLYSAGMSKFDHHFETATDRNSILRHHTRNSTRQSVARYRYKQRLPFDRQDFS